MLKAPLSVIATAGFGRRVGGVDCPLRSTEGEEFSLEDCFFAVFQNKVRRASRYVKFANLGAHLCLKKLDPAYLRSQRVGLFLGTGLGNIPDIVNFTSEIFCNFENSVAPGAFVNTVSNAGLFYAARALGMDCTTTVISQETVSFETALLSAGLCLERQEIDLALVGGVDVVHPPAQTAFCRLGSEGASPETLGEGSAFVALVRNVPSEIPSLAKLVTAEVFMSSREEGMERLLKHGRKAGFLSCGIDQKQSELPELARRAGRQPYPYRNISGDYSTASSFALSKALMESQSLGNWCHVNFHKEGLNAYFHVAFES